MIMDWLKQYNEVLASILNKEVCRHIKNVMGDMPFAEGRYKLDGYLVVLGNLKLGLLRSCKVRKDPIDLIFNIWEKAYLLRCLSFCGECGSEEFL